MAAKLVALYTEPADRAEFDRLYFETHVPLAQQLPGLARMEVVKFTENLMGKPCPYYMMAELVFDSVADLHSALNSPQGKEAAKNIMSFAAANVTLLVSELAAVEGAGVY